MKKNKQISKLVASAAIAVASIAPSFAQTTNVGAACGCPTIAARSTVQNTVMMSSLPGYVAIAGTYGGELTQGATLTCDKMYIIDKKIYIPSGQVINIAPGTVLKGKVNTVAAEATALIIERGGKINASGEADCQIVFTAEADPLDGSYSIANKGMWGGLVILGKATNNLTLAANGPFVPGGAGKLAVADGLGTVEGFASTNPQDQYGVITTLPTNLVSSTSPASTTYTLDLNLATTQGSGAGAVTNTKITVSSSTLAAYVFAGMTITGTGVPAGATVTAVSSSTITFSAALTLTAAGSYTFTGTYPLAPSTAATYYTLPATGSPATYPTSAPAFANSTYGPFGSTSSIINYAAPYYATGGAGSFDDEDNSGTLKYVSIRHSGAILAVGAEINGLTLASVGRGTTIDHIEIVSCADDNIELFGGTVNLKYVSTLFGNDDMIDYDLGWSGKAQFVFGMKTDVNASADSDNGFEADSYDNSSTGLKSKPVFYNVTMIGNAKATGNSDNSALAAINMKDGSEGEIFNSIFANFRNGLNLVSNNTSGGQPNTLTSWTNGNLKVKCNTFVNVTNPGTIAASSSSVGTAFTSTQLTQFTTTDLNTIVAGNTLPGFDYSFTVSNYASNSFSAKNDVTPNPALSISGCPTPVDGFFRPADYRGAFSSAANSNWLSDWSYSKVLGATKGLVACPTDIDASGTTDVTDFLLLIGNFNNGCN